MIEKIYNIISVSGGKDSAATWSLAKERGVQNMIPVFADTGHEHPATLEYLDYLEQKLGKLRRVKADFTERFEVRRRNLPELWAKDGIPQERIDKALELLQPTGIPFLDLCMLRSRFPSPSRRFCSFELKHAPIRRFLVDPLLDEDATVVSWQGVRANESPARRNLDVVEERDDVIIYRPILLWTAKEVFDFHRRIGIQWNPLYENGMTRVGCMPCIHVGKNELFNISKRYPEELKRLREWERLVSDVSKRGKATFFAPGKTPDGKKQAELKDGVSLKQVILWASTSRGGRNLKLDFEDHEGCKSVYGLCE